MKRTIWLQFIAVAILFAALMVDEHVIRAQADELRRADSSLIAGDNTMTQARHALRVQGDALEQCMRAVDPMRNRPTLNSTISAMELQSR